MGQRWDPWAESGEAVQRVPDSRASTGQRSEEKENMATGVRCGWEGRGQWDGTGEVVGPSTDRVCLWVRETMQQGGVGTVHGV